jgi:CheY-like chemotaxis protein
MPEQDQTILIVDGDVVERTVIADYLRGCGYKVIEANSGHEAIQALEHYAFSIQIVLSDIQLPGEVNGFQLATWIRQNFPDVELLLASAPERAVQTAGQLCEQATHFRKPYDTASVLDHIKRLKGA